MSNRDVQEPRHRSGSRFSLVAGWLAALLVAAIAFLLAPSTVGTSLDKLLGQLPLFLLLSALSLVAGLVARSSFGLFAALVALVSLCLPVVMLLFLGVLGPLRFIDLEAEPLTMFTTVFWFLWACDAVSAALLIRDGGSVARETGERA